ncbi:hypothetical protein FBY06_11835 [Pseudomonas sp. SJZ085]|uniref:hypothetical protein n=1 Tax=unclassified Pseudomonas TaxID=196821 RepID=UPI00119A9320|nr:MULTISPECIES: hypothetical protein [unclassified Pseudomonas]TWC17117.1 hypothetical protein FBX99_118109 [Pseudomonas sp. SJZ074]TWC35129.1 hypothetical protein FBY06_11835 [Pseudomonas sp. SJZ085]
MPAEKKIAPNIQLALDYSRSFAAAKPNIGLTEKEHIEGLANLLERTAAENQALQELLNQRDEAIHDLEQRRHAEQQACQAAERRIEDLLQICRGIQNDTRLWLMVSAELSGRINAALNPTAEAASPEHVCPGCNSKDWSANCDKCIPY